MHSNTPILTCKARFASQYGTSILVPFSLVYMLQANKGGKDKLEKTVSIRLHLAVLLHVH